jgi:hypothetical protein
LTRQKLKDGQHEGCRFTGAGLGAADEILSVPQLRDGLLLDGSRAACSPLRPTARRNWGRSREKEPDELMFLDVSDAEMFIKKSFL